MEPEPERMSDEELLSRTRELRERLLARLPGIRPMGVEVDAFLAECERFIEAKEGRSGEWVDSYEFMQRISAFHDEMKAQGGQERAAKRAEAQAAIPQMLEVTADLAAKLRKQGTPTELRTARELEMALANARERLARGEVPLEELEDFSLAVRTQVAEMERRERYKIAAFILACEQGMSIDLSKLKPEERALLEEHAAKWAQDREKLLGELPLEDRRRLEAMTAEDFNRAETWMP